MIAVGFRPHSSTRFGSFERPGGLKGSGQILGRKLMFWGETGGNVYD